MRPPAGPSSSGSRSRSEMARTETAPRRGPWLAGAALVLALAVSLAAGRSSDVIIVLSGEEPPYLAAKAAAEKALAAAGHRVSSVLLPASGKPPALSPCPAAVLAIGTRAASCLNGQVAP